MTVYVDNVRIPKGRAFYCHMWADSLPELQAMAARLKLKKNWLQRPPKAKWFHYDLLLRQRETAIAYGAVLTDKYGPAEHEARADAKSDDPARVERGEATLNRIAASRARERKDKLDQGRLL